MENKQKLLSIIDGARAIILKKFPHFADDNSSNFASIIRKWFQQLHKLIPSHFNIQIVMENLVENVLLREMERGVEFAEIESLEFITISNMQQLMVLQQQQQKQELQRKTILIGSFVLEDAKPLLNSILHLKQENGSIPILLSYREDLTYSLLDHLYCITSYSLATSNYFQYLEIESFYLLSKSPMTDYLFNPSRLELKMNRIDSYENIHDIVTSIYYITNKNMIRVKLKSGDIIILKHMIWWNNFILELNQSYWFANLKRDVEKKNIFYSSEDTAIYKCESDNDIVITESIYSSQSICMSMNQRNSEFMDSDCEQQDQDMISYQGIITHIELHKDSNCNCIVYIELDSNYPVWCSNFKTFFMDCGYGLRNGLEVKLENIHIIWNQSEIVGFIACRYSRIRLVSFNEPPSEIILLAHPYVTFTPNLSSLDKRKLWNWYKTFNKKFKDITSMKLFIHALKKVFGYSFSLQEDTTPPIPHSKGCKEMKQSLEDISIFTVSEFKSKFLHINELHCSVEVALFARLKVYDTCKGQIIYELYDDTDSISNIVLGTHCSFSDYDNFLHNAICFLSNFIIDGNVIFIQDWYPVIYPKVTHSPHKIGNYRIQIQNISENIIEGIYSLPDNNNNVKCKIKCNDSTQNTMGLFQLLYLYNFDNLLPLSKDFFIITEHTKIQRVDDSEVKYPIKDLVVANDILIHGFIKNVEFLNDFGITTKITLLLDNYMNVINSSTSIELIVYWKNSYLSIPSKQLCEVLMSKISIKQSKSNYLYGQNSKQSLFQIIRIVPQEDSSSFYEHSQIQDLAIPTVDSNLNDIIEEYYREEIRPKTLYKIKRVKVVNILKISLQCMREDEIRCDALLTINDGTAIAFMLVNHYNLLALLLHLSKEQSGLILNELKKNQKLLYDIKKVYRDEFDQIIEKQVQTNFIKSKIMNFVVKINKISKKAIEIHQIKLNHQVIETRVRKKLYLDCIDAEKIDLTQEINMLL